MRFPSRVLEKVVVLMALAAPAVASADVPSDPICQSTAGCVVCTEVQGGNEQSDADYAACVASAEDDGLQLSCAEGASITKEYWCPEGVDAHVDADEGCSASGSHATQGAALLMTCAAALGLSLARRRKEKAS